MILPLPSSRYGLWLGLGALALDLIIALIVTSLLRQHLAPCIWRALHYLAYLAWPVALVHGAGIGTDSGAIWMLVVDAACVAAFGGSVALRLLTAPSPASKHLSPPRVRVAP